MGRAKTEKFPIFAGFSLDPKTNKMSAGYIIGISIKPADFGLTGSEDNATMAAAVVKSLEAQGAAEATARAEAAEQRAEALAAEVARLRADALLLAGLANHRAVYEMDGHDAEALDVAAERADEAADGVVIDVIRRALWGVAEAQPAEVVDG